MSKKYTDRQLKYNVLMVLNFMNKIRIMILEDTIILYMIILLMP